MRSNERKALHTKDISELKKLFDEARSALSALKLEHAQRKLKNTRSMYTKRKEIAKIQTVLQQKKKEEESGKARSGSPAKQDLAAQDVRKKEGEKEG